MATEREARLRLTARDDASRTIGRVGVALSALGRQAGLQRVAGQLRNVRTALGGVARQARALRTVGVGIAGLAGAAGLSAGAIIAMGRSYATATDELAKFGRTVGISLQGMRDLQFVAGRQGVTNDELATSLLALSKRVGEVKAGTGSLTTLLKKQNPALLAQIKAAEGTEEAFDLVMNAAAGMGDETQRNAFLAAAFGRSGLVMARMSELGAKGFRDLVKEGRRLQGVLGEDAGPAAERFMDALGDVGTALGGVRDAIAKAVLPVLTPLLEQLRDWIALNRDAIRDRVATWIRDFARWIERIDWQEVRRGLRDFGTSLRDVGRRLRWAVDQVGGLRNALLILAGISLAPLALAVVNLGAAIGRLALVTLSTRLGVFTLAAGAAAWAGHALARAWEPVKEKLGEAWTAIKEGGKALFEVPGLILSGDWQGAIERVKTWSEETTRAFNRVLDAHDAWAKVMRRDLGLGDSWWERLLSDLPLVSGIRGAAELRKLLEGWQRSFEESAVESGRAIAEQMGGGMRGGRGEVEGAAEDLANSVSDYLPQSPARRGPLRHLVEMGREIVRQLAAGIRSASGELAAAMRDALAGIGDVTGVGGAARHVGGLAGKALGGAKKALGSAFGKFRELAPRIMGDLMRDFRLTREQAAGIVGNLGHESGGFRHMQELGKGAGRGGFGWAQWTGPRRRAFMAFARANGLDPKSYAANYQFMTRGEPGEWRRALRAVRGQETASGAMRAFEQTYERAGVKAYGSRLAYTRQALRAANDTRQPMAAGMAPSADAMRPGGLARMTRQAQGGGTAKVNLNGGIEVSFRNAPRGTTVHAKGDPGLFKKVKLNTGRAMPAVGE